MIYAVYKASTEDRHIGSSSEVGGEGIGGGGWVLPDTDKVKENVEANEGCQGEARRRGKKMALKERRRGTNSASRKNSTKSSGTRTASGFGGTRGR